MTFFNNLKKYLIIFYKIYSTYNRKNKKSNLIKEKRKKIINHF